MAREVRCHQTDRRTDGLTHRPTTVTLAAHERRGLMTAKNLEQYVCGMEEIDIMMLKKVVRYKIIVSVMKIFFTSCSIHYTNFFCFLTADLFHHFYLGSSSCVACIYSGGTCLIWTPLGQIKVS